MEINSVLFEICRSFIWIPSDPHGVSIRSLSGREYRLPNGLTLNRERRKRQPVPSRNRAAPLVGCSVVLDGLLKAGPPETFQFCCLLLCYCRDPMQPFPG